MRMDKQPKKKFGIIIVCILLLSACGPLISLQNVTPSPSSFPIPVPGGNTFDNEIVNPPNPYVYESNREFDMGDDPDINNEQQYFRRQTIGEIVVDYPVRMSQSSSDTVFVRIATPKITIADPSLMARVTPNPFAVDPYLGQYAANILVAPIVRVELTSLGFKVSSSSALEQRFSPNGPDVLWHWIIMTSGEIGRNVIVINVFDSEDIPYWTGSFYIDVVPPTSTMTPALALTSSPTSTLTPSRTPIPTQTSSPTPTPTQPSTISKIGSRLVDNSALILTALISLAGVIFTVYFQNRKKTGKKPKAKSKS